MSRGHAVRAGDGAISRDRHGPASDTLQKYLRAVRGFFIKRVQASEVDDMVQTVALRIQSRGEASSAIENPERYIFQVARSVMIDQHRKNVSRQAARHETLEEWHHPVDEMSPDRIVESADALQHVMNALHCLPTRTRQAFVLHRFEHLSYGDIAAEMGISISAVEKHIMRAIRKLSVALDDE
ncbi:RNA polymerase sigma factor [Altericroceibacterium spongiae]|uniref:RNA polymerase sigma factor n=1 Tax=Altericroceibacterium spongiae TaxID=2320269 RepID=A0A420EM19_9SPHN|nr:RNA polymerase sigma factor [Altericroceibacterium spongiae]RKF21690.1 RNA polymerase sigma factor [Altericroceibacterium spongiae]